MFSWFIFYCIITGNSNQPISFPLNKACQNQTSSRQAQYLEHLATIQAPILQNNFLVCKVSSYRQVLICFLFFNKTILLNLRFGWICWANIFRKEVLENIYISEIQDLLFLEKQNVVLKHVHPWDSSFLFEKFSLQMTGQIMKYFCVWE